MSKTVMITEKTCVNLHVELNREQKSPLSAYIEVRRGEKIISSLPLQGDKWKEPWKYENVVEFVSNGLKKVLRRKTNYRELAVNSLNAMKKLIWKVE